MKQQRHARSPTPASAEPVFSELISFRLHTLAKLVDQHAEATHRSETGLGLLESRVIGVVGAHGPLSFKSLCELAELEKSNASRLVARLIEQGWIERQDDPSDARSFIVVPTAAGRRLRQSVFRSAAARNERWLSVLSDAQRRTLADCLDLLTARAREMLVETDDRASTARAAPSTQPGPDEEPRLAWIDRQLADQLYTMLATALQKPQAPTPKETRR